MGLDGKADNLVEVTVKMHRELALEADWMAMESGIDLDQWVSEVVETYIATRRVKEKKC